MPLVLKELASSEATNRRNAAFCAGELCKNGGDSALKYISNWINFCFLFFFIFSYFLVSCSIFLLKKVAVFFIDLWSFLLLVVYFLCKWHSSFSFLLILLHSPQLVRYYADVLRCLYPLFGESEPDDAVRDNAAGAVARMIMVRPDVVPLNQVHMLPVII